MEYSLHILLADDEEIVHRTIVDYLRDLGHHVDEVYDGHAVLKSIEAHGYDLAIVDIRMPCIDWSDLVIKAKELRPEMPVVIITGHRSMDMTIQALRLGAADFLTKPIKLLELDAVLGKSVRFRKLVVQHIRDVEALREAHDKLELRAKKRTTEDK